MQWYALFLPALAGTFHRISFARSRACSGGDKVAICLASSSPANVSLCSIWQGGSLKARRSSTTLSTLMRLCMYVQSLVKLKMCSPTNRELVCIATTGDMRHNSLSNPTRISILVKAISTFRLSMSTIIGNSATVCPFSDGSSLVNRSIVTWHIHYSSCECTTVPKCRGNEER